MRSYFRHREDHLQSRIENCRNGQTQECFGPGRPRALKGKGEKEKGGREEGWLSEWVDGWVDGWMGGWVGGWVDGWVDGWIGGWVGECMDGWGMNGWEGGWEGGWVSGYRDGRELNFVLSCRACAS